MTKDDLKGLQDHLLAKAQVILQQSDHLRPAGFVVTLHKHLDKLFESGYGVEFLDPKQLLSDDPDGIAVLIVDLLMGWKRLYHAILSLFPPMRDVLPGLLEIGVAAEVDDPYMRVVRPFLSAAQLDEKDITIGTVRQICDKTDAFACIYQSEAWIRMVRSSDREAVEGVRQNGLSQDAKAIEVVLSTMEAHDFGRSLMMPIEREPSSDPSKRDQGKVRGFGTPKETGAMQGRVANFLKPLPEAS